jgi:predicted dinucleotide-binding enzyme
MINTTAPCIGIIGKGNVAKCLGPLWGAKGYKIVYAVKEPEHNDVRALLANTPGAVAIHVSEVTKLADVILLSVRWCDIKTVISQMGDVNGKILIDCITPMAVGKKELLLGHTTSASEQIAQLARGASVVKAFDTAGINTMLNPLYEHNRATVFVCGDDVRAKSVVGRLAEVLGFDVCDAGALAVARYLEPVAMLWVHLSLVRGLGDIGFKLLHRNSEKKP